MNIAATIKDVANRAGVSIATVSKYINGIHVKKINQETINEAIKALDYKVNAMARGLKTNRTMTVGVLIPSLENIFATSIVSHIESILLQHGYGTIICDYNNDAKLENDKFDFLLDKLTDGIIMIPLSISQERIKKAIQQGISIIIIDRLVQGCKCDVVLADNLNASYHAVEHLITKGHREIGIICGPKNIYTSQERLKGYFRVHEDYHLKVNQENILFGEYDIQSGYNIMKQILKNKGKPTAVFITNYEMTLGAVMALNELEVKVPEALSVIGFDNQQLAKVVKPTLAIVIQPLQQIGESAANLLLKRMDGEKGNFPSMLRLKTEMKQGQSIMDITGQR